MAPKVKLPDLGGLDPADQVVALRDFVNEKTREIDAAQRELMDLRDSPEVLLAEANAAHARGDWPKALHFAMRFTGAAERQQRRRLEALNDE